ncbi:gtpase-activating protein gyp5 [Ophiostoma piceae UAMH 11346]|uniref:GTPase-activating protein GYP5 n=1 Tax=Ophiostoma piceae (strain UAMH 11346) TaxID=1262450 RepID=S3CMK2_OPHP1|nr:gtpase-activating protein gyp5 [Ophiostoma piceae UAMH 11346]
MSDPKDELESPVAAPVNDAASDSDRDTDTFEDAPDTATTERSLTNRKPSFSASRLSKSSIAPAADAGKSELEQAFQKLRRNRTASSAHAAAPGDNRNSISNNEAVESVESAESIEIEPISEIRDTEPEDAELSSATTATAHTTASSPTTETESNSFTTSSHRPKSTDTEEFNLVSNTDLDNVNLDDDTPVVPAKDAVVITATAPSPIVETEAPPPPPEKEVSSKTLSLSSFTSVIPSIPWSPSNTSDSTSKPLPVSPSPPPPGTQPTRKLTSPFSWLSRGSSKEAAVTSPPLPQASPPIASTRRNTASSVATLTSNPEMMLSKLEEESGRQVGTGRASLKDRFKMIRLREEAGAAGAAGAVTEEDGKAADGSSSPKLTVGLGLPVPTAGDDQIPTSPMPSSPNPSLAPGTVSGVTAGPSSIADANVDWDLWQNVMQEGPAAVARSSPEELNKAIATGIPSAIRGVIWQVLAQSKNEELEAVYHDLLARGTEREKDRRSSASIAKDTASSSASSVHSGDSASAASANNISAPNGSAATPAESIVQRKKKEKDDAAALQKLEKVIRRDLGTRTSYSKFAAAQGLQDGLFGVCKAYALFDEAVGYAQGMNFLIMPILFNMPEEEAFCLLVRLMNQYKLRDLFIQDMPGLHMHLYIFERLLEDLEPALYCHLHRRGISPHLYATQWFLTLFAYRFPLQLVLRIYDLILSEGLTAILKFGIVLMQKNATTLLGMSDMSQLTTYLKDRLFDVYIDASPSAGSILENGFFGSSSSSLDKEVYRADQFVRDACEVKLTPELVKTYTTEWQEKTRAEKERETELETLRSMNASLSVRVRKFEERIESVDREQAALATELVHTKVENEELRDENESLRGQVRELKNVIQQQPDELENAWKAERSDLIGRNTKVHEENQRVEKELAELEEELVQTKMRYAEINSQHETLQKKWSELKRQFA